MVITHKVNPEIRTAMEYFFIIKIVIVICFTLYQFSTVFYIKIHHLKYLSATKKIIDLSESTRRYFS